MKGLLEFLALPLSLPISPIWDFVICAIIGEIAYQVAFSYAGRNGSSSGERTLLHWLIRFPVYFGLWLMICILILIVKFIKANWIWILVILGMGALIGGSIILIRRHKLITNRKDTR